MDIASAVGTTLAYIYNVRSELKKRGIQPNRPGNEDNLDTTYAPPFWFVGN
jgi:hypothetical protein